MMLTKRERTCIEMANLAEELDGFDEYCCPDDRVELLEASTLGAKEYWSQSKIDTRIRRLKQALLGAKAARYDAIAPEYDQLCMDMSEPTSKNPEWTTSSDIDPQDLPF